jgi:hypothetical protein
MKKSIAQAINDLADLWSCSTAEFNGATLRGLFTDADKTPGCNVYWGMWTEAELDTVIDLKA